MVAGDPMQLAFPTLSEKQIFELARCAGVAFESHPGGETLVDVVQTVTGTNRLTGVPQEPGGQPRAHA